MEPLSLTFMALWVLGHHWAGNQDNKRREEQQRQAAAKANADWNNRQ